MSATNRFNGYMSTHFSGCQLLWQTLDPHRNRELKFYRIPGEWELVGLSDGTDAFMVPTSTADPISTKIRKILEDVRNGKQPEIAPLLRRRIASAPAAEPAPTGLQRRPSHAAPPTPPSGGLQRRAIRS